MADKDFGKKIGDFGQNIWKKAQGAVDGVSLKNDIATIKRELAQIYTEVGTAFCKQTPDKAEKAFPQLFSEAAALEAELVRLQDKLQRIKGIRKCPGCGETVPQGAAFCAKCGTRVPEPEPEPEPEPDEAPICRVCGATLEQGSAFCSCCGEKQD